MNSEIMLVMELNEKEMKALKLLLGRIPHNKKKEEYGLTEEQCAITSQIWDMIPDDE